MSNPIEVHGLVKTFGRSRALDGLDLAVAPGEVHGFLGPNGSGKSCFGISALTRAAGDEREGRTETLLATATSRRGLLVAVAGSAVIGSTWLLLVSGAATAIGRGEGLDPVGAALVQAPAVWLVLALGLLLLSVRSRWAVAGWALVAACVTLGQVGESLDLPGWLVGLSPYHHVSRYPAETIAWRPELVLTVLALGALAASWTRYRSRDIG